MAATGQGNVQLSPNNVGQRTRAIASSKRRTTKRYRAYHSHGVIKGGFWYADLHVELQFADSVLSEGNFYARYAIYFYENFPVTLFQQLIQTRSRGTLALNQGIGDYTVNGYSRTHFPKQLHPGAWIGAFSANPDLKFGNW